MAGLDVVKVLSYGVIGLGFLLALFSYRLLSKEQKLATPRREMLRAINIFMAFSVSLCLVGILGQFLDARVKNSVTTTPKDAGAKFQDFLAKKRVELGLTSLQEAFRRGELAESGEETLTFKMLPDACKRYLAVVSPPNECDIYWWTNGPGAKEVLIDKSGEPSYKTGNICTKDKPVEIGLKLKMVRGSGSYSLETYFVSQKYATPRPAGEK
jgi:hypothetical protein